MLLLIKIYLLEDNLYMCFRSSNRLIPPKNIIMIIKFLKPFNDLNDNIL